MDTAPNPRSSARSTARSAADATPMRDAASAHSKRSRLRIAAAGITVAFVAIIAVATWFLFFRDDAPPPVTMDSALNDTSSLSSSGAGSSNAAGSDSGNASTGATTDGTWVLAANSESFVGYRVGEELAGIGATEAVGRTSEVDTNVTLSGSQVTAATINVDMTQLQSDSDRRDGALERQSLETATYPDASFVLTSPIDIGETPTEGQTYTVNATGDLTLHGTTNAVTTPLEARFSDGFLVVIGTTDIVFADYNIQAPESQALLGVDDHGTLELQLILSQQAVS